MIITIIVFALVLSVIVFVHELGHFSTARKLGVKVDEFGLGLPPRIFGLRKIDGKFKLVFGKKPIEKDGPTIYSLNWIPVGGFVKIKGESGEEAEASDSFAGKAIWKRVVMIVAGVVMNVILCMILLSIGFGFGMPASLDDNLSSRAIVSNKSLQIIQLMPEGQAKIAGVQVGDVIAKVDGREFETISELNTFLSSNNDKELNFEFIRRGEAIEKKIKISPYSFEEREVIGIGIGLIETATVRYPWYLAVYKGIVATFVWMLAIVVAFATVIKNLIIGVPTGVEVAGPVGIAVLTGQAAKMGVIYLLQFTALLSLNLAIINILPFPALDGGRLLFLILEKIRGKAVKQEWENLAHNIGFLILMGLVLLVTFGDIVKYGGGLFGFIKNIFGL
ncbi:MAG: RIP metalloprotease RseP [Candidatus Buchananbacteria bacterium]|nr:RIP metalloprotease RseP [Candidatus Buchananbacteria bacterium]